MTINDDSVRYHTLTNDSGSWRVSLHDLDNRPAGEPGGSEAIIMIDDNQTVLVRGNSGRLNTPGAMPEPSESSEETMIRGVRQQALAEVTSWVPIAFALSEKMDGDAIGRAMVRDMYVARVELLPWSQPSEEIVERIVVPIDDLATIMNADWPGLEEFSAELIALAKAGLADI